MFTPVGFSSWTFESSQRVRGLHGEKMGMGLWKKDNMTEFKSEPQTSMFDYIIPSSFDYILIVLQNLSLKLCCLHHTPNHL